MKTSVTPADHPQAYPEALRILSGGGVVAFPTDTVYGIGVLVNRPSAIDQLYSVKDRDQAKSIAVLIGEVSALEQVASRVSQTVRRLGDNFWPGPLTLVVPRHPELPANISLRPTVGVRMPDHPVALKLLVSAGPMAVTSANLSGMPSACTAQEILKQLEGRIPLILDGGRTPGGTPSTVIDCTGAELRVLREGPISLEQIHSNLN